MNWFRTDNGNFNCYIGRISEKSYIQNKKDVYLLTSNGRLEKVSWDLADLDLILIL